MYDSLFIGIILAVFGAILGSFATASVWRLRARQLVIDDKNGERVDKAELKRIKPLVDDAFGKKDRSRCLHCGYELKWFDMIPVLSWLALRGKCRQCHKKIGWLEFLTEVGLAAFFVLSYIFWPGGVATGLQIAHFSLWLVAGVVLAMLFAYDLKWYLLPDVLTFILAIIGLGIVGVTAAENQNIVGTLFSALVSLGILSGIYAILHLVSKGNWVGLGDVKLGVGLALILVDWQLALMALLLANLIGCLVVIPLMASKKLKRNSHVPFGPMLIAGTVLAWFIGWGIYDWYMGLSGF